MTHPLRAPLSFSAGPQARADRYQEVLLACRALLQDEDDWVAAMATVVSELHGAFLYFDWTGFDRAEARELVSGPYQGGHGCLRIGYDRGVCGAAARSRSTQWVPDVDAFADHIACSASTRSEIVVPVLALPSSGRAELGRSQRVPSERVPSERVPSERLSSELGAQRQLLAVLDIDSDTPDAFREADRDGLEALATVLGRRFSEA
jgi:GAF domain-containing protein